MDGVIPHTHDRLYQDLARKLIAELAAGKFPIGSRQPAAGSRLPAERELAQQYAVSRPTVREAVIALEVQGLVEVRTGSGAYVITLPGSKPMAGFNISAVPPDRGRLHGVARLPCRTPPPPRLFCGNGRDLHGSRPPDAA